MSGLLVWGLKGTVETDGRRRVRAHGRVNDRSYAMSCLIIYLWLFANPLHIHSVTASVTVKVVGHLTANRKRFLGPETSLEK